MQTYLHHIRRVPPGSSCSRAEKPTWYAYHLTVSTIEIQSTYRLCLYPDPFMFFLLHFPLMEPIFSFRSQHGAKHSPTVLCASAREALDRPGRWYLSCAVPCLSSPFSLINFVQGQINGNHAHSMHQKSSIKLTNDMSFLNISTSRYVLSFNLDNATCRRRLCCLRNPVHQCSRLANQSVNFTSCQPYLHSQPLPTRCRPSQEPHRTVHSRLICYAWCYKYSCR